MNRKMLSWHSLTDCLGLEGILKTIAEEVKRQ